jgi:hypothetical protein
MTSLADLERFPTTNCHSERSEEAPHFVRAAMVCTIAENALIKLQGK